MADARKTAGALGLCDAGAAIGPALAPDTPISGLAVDSRTVAPGMVFVAIRGGRVDGARFAPAAVRAGAAAIVTSLDGALRVRAALAEEGLDRPPIVIRSEPRAALAALAARFYGAQPETMVAATGTNGKTSVATFAAQIFGALDRPCAAFGTAGVTAHRLARPVATTAALTTPEPIALHGLLAELAAAGATHGAMEASSHGLAQFRLDGVRLTAAAFLNLTRDHLDYHADAEDYAAAKLRLFAEVLPADGTAVVNADDPLGGVAAAIAGSRGRRVIAFGRGAGPEGIRLLGQDPHLGGQRLRIAWAGAERVLELPLLGSFQGWNALAAAGLAIGCGEDPAAVFDALEGLTGVRGRMELAARRANGAGVFVDYAHTPDAVATALAALRPHIPGRLIVVVGAGGDRDPGKRPLMGAAAVDGADAAIITDDNPRSEDPAAIRAAVAAGAAHAPDRMEIVGDRAEAILRGVDALRAGDALLIAGKGHETGQEVAGETLPFDDGEQARAAVGALDGGVSDP